MPSKSGNLTKVEIKFIKDMAATMSPEEICRKLDRPLELIKLHIVEKPAEQKEIAAFHDSITWRKLADEFSPEELLYFNEEYADLVSQFKEDVLKTEEQQIRKAITFDILMRRNLSLQRKSQGDISRLEAMQQNVSKDYKLLKQSMTDDQRHDREEFILQIETQLQAVKGSLQAKSKEFTDLDNRHQKLMEALKATREQRISKIESSNKSFLAVLRELAEAEKRKEADRQIGLMSLATDNEFKRLAKPHKYDDGNEDLPVLSAETMEILDATNAEAIEAEE